MTKTEAHIEEETVRVGFVSEADKRELEEYFRNEPTEEQELEAARAAARAYVKEEPW